MADNVEKKQSVEEMFSELEQTIDRLSKEDVLLEEAFSLYEKGMKLVKSCEEEIDIVEKKVLELDGGSVHEFQ